MIQLVKILAFPTALFASLFTSYTAKYELPLSLMISLGMVVFAQHAFRTREYLWAAELIAIAVIFSPILLIAKLFLLMALAFSVACAALFTAVRVPPPPGWKTVPRKKNSDVFNSASI